MTLIVVSLLALSTHTGAEKAILRKISARASNDQGVKIKSRVGGEVGGGRLTLIFSLLPCRLSFQITLFRNPHSV